MNPCPRGWLNDAQAAGGKIFIICDTKRTVKGLTSEINSALAGYTYNSHLTDLEELQMKKRGRMEVSGFINGSIPGYKLVANTRQLITGKS